MTTTVAEALTEPSAVEDKQAQADFDAGVAMEDPRPKTAPSSNAKPSENAPVASLEARSKSSAAPEYVQITKQQFDRFETFAKRADDFERQMSKAFGTIGDVQKIVRTLQGQTPRGVAVKIPDGAFAAMEKDFPEVAQHLRAGLEATLKGIEGTGGSSAHVDPAEFERQVEKGVIGLQVEELDDAYPDWRQIVGQVDTTKGEKPDPKNQFRAWLATKDQSYQNRINGTNSAGVITRAIRRFKSETKAVSTSQPQPGKQGGAARARASLIQESVRPKSAGGHPPGKSADEDFEAGFRTG